MNKKRPFAGHSLTSRIPSTQWNSSDAKWDMEARYKGVYCRTFEDTDVTIGIRFHTNIEKVFIIKKTNTVLISDFQMIFVNDQRENATNKREKKREKFIRDEDELKTERLCSTTKHKSKDAHSVMQLFR